MSVVSIYLIDKEYSGHESKLDISTEHALEGIVTTLYSKYFASGLMFSSSFENVVDYTREKYIDKFTFTDAITFMFYDENIFSSKDKERVANSLYQFQLTNKRHMKNYSQRKKDTFDILIEYISNIDEEKYPYFQFQNSGVYDDVWSLFHRYDPYSGNVLPRKLSEFDVNVVNFVSLLGVTYKLVNNLDHFHKCCNAANMENYLVSYEFDDHTQHGIHDCVVQLGEGDHISEDDVSMIKVQIVKNIYDRFNLDIEICDIAILNIIKLR